MGQTTACDESISPRRITTAKFLSEYLDKTSTRHES